MWTKLESELDQAVVREHGEGVVGRDCCGGSCSAGVFDVFGTLRVTCGCWAGTWQEYVRTAQENASKKVLCFQVFVRWFRVGPGGFLRVVIAMAGLHCVMADLCSVGGSARAQGMARRVARAVGARIARKKKFSIWSMMKVDPIKWVI